MADAGAEQWRSKAEEVAEAAVQPITNVVDASDLLQFDDIGDNTDGTANEEDEILHETSASEAETEESYKFGEVVEEETVELEFEKVKPKLATHSMHCPNCKTEITRVILRRKVIAYRHTGPDQVEPRPEQKDLVGCCSCLSLFTCSESCFSMFWAVGKQQKDLIQEDPPQPDPILHVNNPKLEDQSQPEPLYVNRESIISVGQVHAHKYDTGYNPKLEDYQQPEPLYVNRQSIINFGQVQSPKYVTKTTTSIPKDTLRQLSWHVPESSNATRDDDSTIIIENAPVFSESRGRSWRGYEGVLVDILKSIVYGGLMEVIASLSVVASAAASNAAALSIVSMALASLIGGVFVIGHNLWDLRDDCYKYSSSEETNEAATNKYKELLGQINYFPLHVFFAILSFLVFGMVPPVAYGYSFHETNDKDFTLVVAAIASLLCVLLLTMIKAYISKCTVLEYSKTVVYYIIIAVSVSGVSYVVGNLIARLIEELGWFNTSSGGGDMPCLSRAITPYLESF